MLKTTLDQYDNSWYQPGRSLPVRMLWHLVSSLVFQSNWLPLNGLKIRLLRAFGAQIGQGVVIKPAVTIKYPWRLAVGNHVWIGEQTWIDNLADVRIGSHACISQGAMLLTGSHNYKQPTFDLMLGSIVLEEGSWIGAKSVVCPGVVCRSHSVLAVNSVATNNLEAYKIYQGNPAVVKRNRVSTSSLPSIRHSETKAVFAGVDSPIA